MEQTAYVVSTQIQRFKNLFEKLSDIAGNNN